MCEAEWGAEGVLLQGVDVPFSVSVLGVLVHIGRLTVTGTATGSDVQDTVVYHSPGTGVVGARELTGERCGGGSQNRPPKESMDSLTGPDVRPQVTDLDRHASDSTSRLQTYGRSPPRPKPDFSSTHKPSNHLAFPDMRGIPAPISPEPLIRQSTVCLVIVTGLNLTVTK